MRKLWTQAAANGLRLTLLWRSGHVLAALFYFCAAQQMTETPDANMPGIWEHIIAFSSSFRPYRRVRFRLPRARKISLTEPARHELTNMLPAGGVRTASARTAQEREAEPAARQDSIADDRLAGRIA